MLLSNENMDFLIKVVRECYTKLKDENNILNHTIHITEEQLIEYIKNNQSLSGSIDTLNEVLTDIQVELTHDIPDEDKVENIREIINNYVI